jgi:hypothetical protein
MDGLPQQAQDMDDLPDKAQDMDGLSEQPQAVEQGKDMDTRLVLEMVEEQAYKLGSVR